MPTPEQIINYHKIKKLPFDYCPICLKEIKTGHGTDAFGNFVSDKKLSTKIYDSLKIDVCDDCIQNEIKKVLARKMRNMPEQKIE